MVYKGLVVTLANYLELFKDYSPDIKDEIRSAILDDTHIMSYVPYCKNDGYTLNQVRLAIREYIPSAYIKPYLGGRCLKLVRDIYHEGLDLTVLNEYLVNSSRRLLPEETMFKMLSAYLSGVDISKMDFFIVPNDYVDFVIEGLRNKYPMWLMITKDVKLDIDVMRALMRAMNLELDITPFIGGDWSANKLNLLFLNAEKMEYSVLLKHINYRFSYDQLESIIRVAVLRLDFLPLCLKSEDGQPLFNSYQIDALSEAIKNDISDDSLFNHELSDREMLKRINLILLDRKKNNDRKLGGKLPRKLG